MSTDVLGTTSAEFSKMIDAEIKLWTRRCPAVGRDVEQ